jgi:hypothetical protein
MAFLQDLWIWLRLRISPLPSELQELAETARALNLRVVRKMTTEEFLAFIGAKSTEREARKKLPDGIGDTPPGN